MIKYDREMKIMTGREYPSQREIELFNLIVGTVSRPFDAGPISVRINEGSDNDIYNVYYNGRQVFCIRYGTSDAVVLYMSGPWEELITSLLE